MDWNTLVRAAVLAPSGDNCQPWRFEVRDGNLHVFNLPDADTSVYNLSQRASFVAHGALLENLTIAASCYGFVAEIDFFPEPENPDFVARVRLREREGSENPLFPEIAKRTTNRRRYDKRKLSPEQLAVLRNVWQEGYTGRVLLFEEGAPHETLIELIGQGDRTVFENRMLHAFLFRQMRWTESEVLETKDGMDVRSFELSAFDRAGLPFLRHWKVVSFMNHFGLSRIFEGAARKQALSAAALGLIAIPDNSPVGFARGGMLMQRVWLEATRLGLSFHLMAGSSILLQQVHEGISRELNPHHVERYIALDKRVREACGVKGSEALVAAFRVGFSAPPTVRSYRKDVAIEEKAAI